MSIFSLLATGALERAVWLSFAFYLLNLLVPIIPATIIYRLFPEGKTSGGAGGSVEGNVGGWKIKAVGAWGAYVTAFLLGFWAIQSTALPLIRAVGGASVWTIDSDFQLTDEQGKEIVASVDKLVVDPPMVIPWGGHATIKVFSENQDPPASLKMKLEGYEPKVVDLTGVPHKEGKINLPPVTLKRLPPIASIPAPTPLPAGTGPAALTSPQ